MSELSIQPNPSPGAPVAASAQAPAHLAADASRHAPGVRQAAQLVAPQLLQVEEELARRLRSDIATIPKVCTELAFAGGKRLRPLITLLSAQAVQLADELAVRLAAVGELLHTATLLHDDVVDQADLRRGRPSARYRYGNAMAVLSGDFCLAQAVSCATQVGELVTLQSVASVVTRMSEGEVAQLEQAWRWTTDRARYYAICQRKTAVLLAWCSSLSGLLAPQLHEATHRFGIELGYAFQISDDVIDYRANFEQSGKDPAQDLREGKMTLPLILAVDKVPSLHAHLVGLQFGAPNDKLVNTIVELVRESGALDACTRCAQDHVRNAQQSLSLLPPSPAKDALLALSEQVAQRSS